MTKYKYETRKKAMQEINDMTENGMVYREDVEEILLAVKKPKENKICNKCGGYKPDDREIFGCSKVCNCPQPSSEECECNCHKSEFGDCDRCRNYGTCSYHFLPSKPRIEECRQCKYPNEKGIHTCSSVEECECDNENYLECSVCNGGFPVCACHKTNTSKPRIEKVLWTFEDSYKEVKDAIDDLLNSEKK